MKILNRFKLLFLLLDQSRRRWFVGLIFLALLGGILETLAFSTIAPVANGILSGEGERVIIPFMGEQPLQSALWLLVMAFFIRTLALVLLSFMQAITVFNIQATISERLFEKYLAINSNADSQKNVSIQAKNVILEAQNITQHGYVPMIAIAGDMVIAMILITYLLWLNGIVLIILFILFILILFILAFSVQDYLGRLGSRRKKMDGYRYQYVNEALDQKDLIFAHRLFAYFWERYAKVNRDSASVGGLQSGLNMSTRWIIEFVLIIVIVGVILFKDGVVLADVSQLAVSAGIAVRLLPLSSKMLANMQRLDYSGPVLKELFGQLYAPHSEYLLENPSRSFKAGPYGLDFKNVRLRVENGNETYFDKEINLSLEAGKIYVVTGRNGVGKSTFIKAMLGSIQTNLCSGEIGLFAFDKSYTRIELQDLSRYITTALVPQDPIFLDTTIRENLTHSVPCEDWQLEELIEKVGLKDYVSTLPKGLDTKMGDKYGYFSGGQRQRLAIARALCRDGDILILDEPTSAADMNFTQDIMAIIRSCALDRIVLVISHSQDIVESCDAEIRVGKSKMVLL